jgi:hypothetical protein
MFMQLVSFHANFFKIDVVHFEQHSKFLNDFEPSLVQSLYQQVLGLD